MTEQELKDLKESVDKIHAALPALFAFRDNHELWMKETGLFDVLVQEVLALVPKPLPAPSPDVQVPAPIAGGIGGNPVLHKSIHGVGIYFQSDTDNTNGQRPPGTTYPQISCVGISGDGGSGMHQNVVWPEDGSENYIPDPTRYAVSYRMDRPGMLSADLYKAGVEFAPGKFRIVSLPGQLFVLMPDYQTGDLTIRLPQPGARLLVEQCATAWNDTTSRRPVLLGDDVGSPARGQI